MTDVLVAPRVENLTSDTESVASAGWVTIYPSAKYISGGQWVHPVPPVAVPLRGAVLTFKLDAIASVPYRMDLYIPDGTKTGYRLTEYRFVTDQGSPVAWEQFALAAGPGGEALPVSDIEARLAALEASNPSGPATNVVNVSGISAYARSYLDDTSQAQFLGTVGAGLDTLAAHLAGTESFTGVKTFTQPVTVATPTANGHAATKLYVDTLGTSGSVPDATASVNGKIRLAGDLSGTATSPTVVGLAAALAAIATLQAQIATTPYLLYPSGGVFPARPATPRSVWFVSSTITPASDGNVLGGGGMVPNLDVLVRAMT